MYSNIIDYFKSSTKCITTKPQRVRTSLFQKIPIPGLCLSLDFVDPFNNGQCILKMIHHFSIHLKLYPVKKITATNTVQAVFDYIVTFGRPERILSDNGIQFKGSIFADFNGMHYLISII